jgi:hypothetical protein
VGHLVKRAGTADELATKPSLCLIHQRAAIGQSPMTTAPTESEDSMGRTSVVIQPTPNKTLI